MRDTLQQWREEERDSRLVLESEDKPRRMVAGRYDQIRSILCDIESELYSHCEACDCGYGWPGKGLSHVEDMVAAIRDFLSVP